jgi:hypothetical protein
MKTDHGEASAVAVTRSKAEQTMGLRKYGVEVVEFTVDTNPKRKENTGGGVSSCVLPRAPHRLLDGSG